MSNLVRLPGRLFLNRWISKCLFTPCCPDNSNHTEAVQWSLSKKPEINQFELLLLSSVSDNLFPEQKSLSPSICIPKATGFSKILAEVGPEIFPIPLSLSSCLRPPNQQRC